MRAFPVEKLPKAQEKERIWFERCASNWANNLNFGGYESTVLAVMVLTGINRWPV